MIENATVIIAVIFSKFECQTRICLWIQQHIQTIISDRIGAQRILRLPNSRCDANRMAARLFRPCQTDFLQCALCRRKC